MVEDDGNRRLIRSLLAIDRCCGKRFVYPRYSGRPPVSLLRRFKSDIIGNRVSMQVYPYHHQVLFQYTNDDPELVASKTQYDSGSLFLLAVTTS